MRARFVFVAAGLVVLVACVPLPVTFYVGDSGAGRVSYGSCSMGVMPEGLVVERSGIQVLADIRPLGDGEVVRLRFDVGHGHRVRLASREVSADPRDGSGPRTGAIGAIDPLGSADPYGWKDLPARRAGLRRPDVVMDDSQLPELPTGPRPVMDVRHYWVASAVATGHASRLWLQLPDLVVDGVLVVFPPIRFDRHTRVVAAPANC